MGLDNVRKVAGGLTGNVYAVKTDDTLHRYTKGTWHSFGDKLVGNSVGVSKSGAVTILDKNEEKAWILKPDETIETAIATCKMSAKSIKDEVVKG